MTPRTFVKLVAAALLLIGIIGAVLQVHAPYHSSTTGTVRESDCGTVFSGNNLGDLSRQESCDDALGSRRAWTFPALALGVLGLAGAAFVRTDPKREAA